jgi:RNA polymerase sigma factor (sigma-70 family)
MKIPKNLTKDQVIDQINIVVDRISPKYTFNGYDSEDIKQEAFIICMDALERYDPSRPLENFLSVHLSNRLKNFVRDNHFTSKDDETKKKLLSPQSIINDSITIDCKQYIDNIDISDIQELIDKNLPSNMRPDYLKIINNVYVPKKRRNEVITTIKNIARNKNEKGAD